MATTRRRLHYVAGFLALTPLGCAQPSITAVSMTPGSNEPEGIPYYLPKPYLVVTKNVRYIPTPTVGLTEVAPIPNSFQSEPAVPSLWPPSSSGDKPGGGSGGGGGGTGGGGTGGGGTSHTAGQAGATANPELAQLTAVMGDSVGDDASKKPKSPEPPANLDAPKNLETAKNQDTPGGNTPKGSENPLPAGASVSQVLGPASIAVVPPAPISDGLIPHTFYTYQVLFLPDLTQKYGLRIKGGAGEMRATNNLVNGWMYTGPGPTYFRDSFTSQNTAAAGQAVASVTDAVGKVALGALGIPSISSSGSGTQLTAKEVGSNLPSKLNDYAEIHVFELTLVKGKKGRPDSYTWTEIPGLNPLKFNRNVIDLEHNVNAGGASGGGGDMQATGKEATDYVRAALKSAGSPFADKVSVTVLPDPGDSNKFVFNASVPIASEQNTKQALKDAVQKALEKFAKEKAIAYTAINVVEATQ